MTDEKRPDPNGEMFSSYYFGDSPPQVAIWTTLATRQQMADEEAKRIAGLSWWWRWLEKFR